LDGDNLCEADDLTEIISGNKDRKMGIREDIRGFPKGALKMVSMYALSSFSSTLKYTMQLDPTHQNENQREAVPRLAFRTDFYQYNVKYTSHSKWYAQWGQMLS